MGLATFCTKLWQSLVWAQQRPLIPRPQAKNNLIAWRSVKPVSRVSASTANSKATTTNHMWRWPSPWICSRRTDQSSSAWFITLTTKCLKKCRWLRVMTVALHLEMLNSRQSASNLEVPLLSKQLRKPRERLLARWMRLKQVGPRDLVLTEVARNEQVVQHLRLKTARQVFEEIQLSLLHKQPQEKLLRKGL